MPPEAEPVRAASTLVATASETNGPPSIESTQSRTVANAGNIATTAPKPTRLATLSTGKTEALAPASILSRNFGNRARLARMRTRIAVASATATDHTPATADREVPPQRAASKKEKQRRGRTTSDIRRFTLTTTASGSTATPIGTAAPPGRPRLIWRAAHRR